MTNPAQQYVVKDASGSIYGPAPIATLRQWVAQGRIVPGMLMATEGSSDWAAVTSHPQLADLFAAPPSGGPQANPYQASSATVGYHSAPVPSYGVPKSTNGMAIAALVSSILGFCFCFLGSILGIIFGFVARSQIKQSNGTQGGEGMALAGIIVGFCNIGLVVVLVVVWLCFVATIRHSPAPLHFAPATPLSPSHF